MTRILVLLIGPSRVASSRVRVLQHLDALSKDLAFRPTILVTGSVHTYHLPAFAAWLLGAWLKRWRLGVMLVRAWFARPFSLVFVHRVLLPPWIIRRLTRLHIPIIFDFDDALAIEGFHRTTIAQSRFHTLVQHAAHVTTSTLYNADQVRVRNPRVSVVVSSVDTRRQPKKRQRESTLPVTIGWIGSPSTAPYLHEIHTPLERLAAERKFRMIVVGGDVAWRALGVEVLHRPWSEATERDDLLTFDIGVMPLPDNEWTRAKGGFKLIQYMSAGLPVVASPVGANVHLVEHGTNGYLASTAEEWFQYLQMLVGSAELRAVMGTAGRAFAEQRYDSSIARKQLHDIMRNLLTT